VATGVGDEGGFAPELDSTDAAIEAILEAAEQAGHRDRVAIALDPASSELYRDGRYHFERQGGTRDAAAMIELYDGLVARYPIVSIGDRLGESALGGLEGLPRGLR